MKRISKNMKSSYHLLVGTLLLIIGICLLPFSRSMAQSSPSSDKTFSPGVTKDLLVGDFDFGASIVGKGNLQYDAPAVSLINLYRMNNFFFQAAVGGEFDDNGNPSISVKFMNVNYLLGKGWELRAGQFDAMPFGRFPRTFDPSWIWPMEATPKGMYALGLTNGDFGVMLQGAKYVGNSVLRSFFYVTNGPTLDSNGLIDAPIIADNNKFKMYGARFSLSPDALSNLELGVNAAYTAGAGDAGTIYERVPVTMWAFDFNYAPTIESLNGFIRLRGQLNLVDVGHAVYPSVGYFKNNSSTYFAMLAYQPSMSDNAFVRNLMFSAMLSHIQVPKGADWGRPSDTQYDLGITYWFNWRTNLKFNYSLTQYEGNAFYIHVGIQI